jgi:hypothetical protein
VLPSLPSWKEATAIAARRRDPLAVTLPYQFDTQALPTNILTGFIAGSAFMLLLALVMLFKYGPLAAVPMTLAAVLLAGVGRKSLAVFRTRAKGTITQDAVLIERNALGRIRLPSNEGQYPLSRFKAVRVTYRGPNRNTDGTLFAEVCLIDGNGTLDVCVAFERDTTAKALAPQIAAAVRLPLEQIGVAPFDH